MEAQEYCSGQPIPSPADLPDPGIELGSPAWQADSLPAELSGKPQKLSAEVNLLGAGVHTAAPVLGSVSPG